MVQSPDTTVVPVYGMTCGRCEAKVSESITALGTDLRVVAERAHDRVTVVGAVDAALVRKAVTELGYRLEPPPHELPHEPPHEIDADANSSIAQRPALDGAQAQLSSDNQGEQDLFIEIKGMSCAACASAVQRAILNVEGVIQSEVNFAAESAWVAGKFDQGAVISAVSAAGYSATEAAEDPASKAANQAQLFGRAMTQATVALLLGSLMMLNMWMEWLSLTESIWMGAVTAVATLGALSFAGADFYKKAWTSLKHGRATMDTLVALSTGTAWLYSSSILIWGMNLPSQHLFFEASLFVIGFVRLGKALEMRARASALSGLDALIRLSPEKASVIDESGRSVSVSLDAVIPGTVVRVSAGERIPLDGEIIVGKTEVDVSLMTGEALPQAVGAGDVVIGGALNVSQPVDIKVTSTKQDGALAQVVRALQRAQNAKPAVAQHIDTITQYFVPGVLLTSLATGFAWWFLLGAEASFAMSTALSVLIIACPCALGLAVPMSLVNAVGTAAKLGLVIRNGDALMRARTLSVLLFDKTGTLTEGNLSVRRELAFGEVQTTYGELRAMVSQSTHPIAKAVAHYIEAKADDPLDADHLEAAGAIETVPGQGVLGTIGGKRVGIGSAAMMRANHFTSNGPIPSDLSAALDEEVSAGPEMYWGVDGQLIAKYELSDRIRDESHDVIQALINAGMTPMMVSGDREQSVKRVAETIGPVNWYAEQSPLDKLALVERLQAEGEHVAVIGDGLNDGPALAAAHFSAAMSSGTALACEQADVTLTNGLRGLTQFIKLSEATARNVRQNLGFAFLYNVLLIPVAAGVLYPSMGWLLSPGFAGLAMALSSLSVVGNAARLRSELGA
ncbi:MAG: heavy metal translocating P-type ATPase [Gammaproteobacteria bacterium]|nr:heavy metal translocating P-type ATPase [Gammaproteobacteria bacterium]